MMDLHTHSVWSDGSESPAQIVRLAKLAGLSLVAVSDHDTMDGVSEAVAEGGAQGIAVLPAIEIDIEHECELHLLAYGLNTRYEPLLRRLDEVDQARNARNVKIIAKLNELGHPIRLQPSKNGITNRTHIARALVESGAVKSIPEAFSIFLGPQGPARFEYRRMDADEAINLIREANGVPVLAHPGQYRGNFAQTVARLAALGLWGIEAYYPAHTEGQVALFRSLASQYGLHVTCGSDFHGDYRPSISVGAASQKAQSDPLAQKTEAFFLERIQTAEN